MINRQALLADLQKFLQRIEADLLERSESKEVPEVPAALHAEYEKAAKAERTAQNYEDWRTDTITQAAAAWVLSCVFVRFLEDNSLIDPPKIAGPGDRLARARDEHELYFRSHPKHTDREYLLSIFGELAKLPGTKEIFGEHNAINDLPNWLSGDAAGELLNFFQKIDASTGELVHDFTDPHWDTRFLGDLYQDLSEAARKKFALLQTPDFVEEFILDRTLEPALDEFGLEQDLGASNHGKLPGFDDRNTLRIPFKMIDPACGSGHFLLGAFPRLLDRWQRKEPGTNIRELTQRALNSIHGVDINPFAVAIAKFRLLLVSMQACDIHRMADAPAFYINVACGDSLLHGENRTSSGQQLWDYAEGATDEELYSHAYPGEDLQKVRALLKPTSYHCVVANPPYIVPKDRRIGEWYRTRFSACHMKYSLAVPFMQQIFQLAVRDGYTGQITANSFMKREFGKKLVELFLPSVDLTHVIDTSGAFIPGHGTPTTILFGRNRSPVSNAMRTVLGIRGEPSTPEIPSQGIVWGSIVRLVDLVNEKNEFVSSCDSPRTLFASHPWAIGGGGLAELIQSLSSSCDTKLEDLVDSIGIVSFTLEDDAFLLPYEAARRCHLKSKLLRLMIEGERLRDWLQTGGDYAAFPYDESFNVIADSNQDARIKFLWPAKPILSQNKMFGSKTKIECGLKWYEFGRLTVDKLRSPLSIVFAFVATHNHFVLDRGNSVSKNSALVVKLKKDATEKDYLRVLGLLNSSIACFYIRENSHDNGGGVEQWERRRQINGTTLSGFPVPKNLPGQIVENIQALSEQLKSFMPISIVMLASVHREMLLQARVSFERIASEMRALQEELDWECYEHYGLLDTAVLSAHPPKIELGQRAFEIILARKIAAGETPSTWFERHGSTPITELPAEWPEDYKRLVERRIELIENDPNIRLIEHPEYKRRWNTESWESQLERALREWLLLRLETYFDFDGRMTDEANASKKPVPLGEIAMCTVAQLADAARRDPQFMEVGELYRDDPAFDVQSLVEELVLAESVPHLPILRYKDSGLRKRAEWEKTWDLQRREDALSDQLSAISDQLKQVSDVNEKKRLEAESEKLTAERCSLTASIPVPPKYTSADFISTGGARYWALRGKLDVPKERWISFPHCEGPDGRLVICWAGYDHLQQAQAISAYYVRVQTEFGGSDDPRLIPLLASLIELLPWLKQWHNEPNANFDGLRMGDYFEGFVNEEARNLGKTLAEIKAWTPPVRTATRNRKKAK